MEPIARSADQKIVLDALLRGESVHSFDYGLRGKAANYRRVYHNSWLDFCLRLREHGFTLDIDELGPRGGIGSATWKLVL